MTYLDRCALLLTNSGRYLSREAVFRLNAPTLFFLQQCKYSQKYEELLTGVFELRGAADRV